MRKMLPAAKASLEDKWPVMSTVATVALTQLSQNLVDISNMVVNQTVTPEQAAILVDMQKSALQTALLGEEGLGLLAAEAAINAVISVIRDTVNTAIGFAVL